MLMTNVHLCDMLEGENFPHSIGDLEALRNIGWGSDKVHFSGIMDKEQNLLGFELGIYEGVSDYKVKVYKENLEEDLVRIDIKAYDVGGTKNIIFPPKRTKKEIAHICDYIKELGIIKEIPKLEEPSFIKKCLNYFKKI